MKRKLLILAGLFMMFQFGFSLSCSRPSYERKNDIIFFGGSVLKNVDIETFEILGNPYEESFAKDKNNIYYAGKIMKGVDSQSFEIISRYEPVAWHPIWGVKCQVPYIEKFKDKNGEYSLEDVRSGKIELEEWIEN